MEQEKPKEELSLAGTIIGLIAIIGMSFWIWNSFIKGQSISSAPTPVVAEQPAVKEYSDIEAYVNAQMILEKFLKSPSTAKYPVANEASIKRYPDNSFQVSAYVDSQNGFGAMIRSEWTVFLKFEEDSVKTRGVIFDGEVLYKEESTEQGS